MSRRATDRARRSVAATGTERPGRHAAGANLEGDRLMAADLDVVVVAFGAPQLLEACLDTLGDAYPRLVVDNSSDAKVRAVTERHGARYLDPGKNLGFAGGVNLGLSERARPWADVLLLNPDASITPRGVAALCRFLHASADLACVAPEQVDADGRPARVGWPFPSPLGAWIEAVGLGSLRRRDDFLIGSVLLIRSTALEAVGPFDERFFLYAEETDWQQRAHRLGWRTARCPSVTASHVGAGTGGDPGQREIRFHASQERYIRKYYGPVGWWAYRAGAMTGALLRAVVLGGDRGRKAAARFHLYRRGPSAVERQLEQAGSGPAGVSRVPPPLSVTHVVVTDAFAGVERYVCQVADELARRGHRVTTIGGDPRRMPAELSDLVASRPAGSLPRAAWALGRQRGTDIVHAHMTAAEGAAWLAHPFNRAPIVATRHFARERGSSTPARALARVTSRALARDVAISQFVADTVAGPTVLIRNGVPDRPQADLASPTVVMMQRLNSEKMPDIGIRAWALSGLADQGWRLVVAGLGELGPSLARPDRRPRRRGQRLLRRSGGGHRPSVVRVVHPAGAGTGRAVRTFGGGSDGPRCPGGGGRRRGPPGDGR